MLEGEKGEAIIMMVEGARKIESHWEVFEKRVIIFEVAPGKFMIRVLDVMEDDVTDSNAGWPVVNEPLGDLGRAIRLVKCLLEARGYDNGWDIRFLQPPATSFNDFPEIVDDLRSR